VYLQLGAQLASSAGAAPPEQAANTKEAAKNTKTKILNRDILLSFVGESLHVEIFDKI
jgi:hypothetical protein